jgi:Cu-processing system ATP-binding protein
MIELTDLTVRYDGADVLRGVNLTIPAGQQVALLGDNGAGKTTLLRALVGLVQFAGRAAVGGADVRGDGIRARRAIGYLPQVPSFPTHLSAAEIVKLFAELRGEPIVASDALAAAADLSARQMSGGMLRRLALAVVQIGAPPVLLLDEPASHLDRAGRELFAGWLDRARAGGATIVLAAHNLRGLDADIDRIVVLDGGRIARDLAHSALRAHRWLEVVTAGPLPEDLPAGATPVPGGNGLVHVKVPEPALAEFISRLDGRPFQVHEPTLEDLLQEVVP